MIREFLKEINNIDMLTVEEECELGDQIYAGNQAKEKLQLLTSEHEIENHKKLIEVGEIAQNKLVEANLRLVVFHAKRYSCDGMELSDLIQEGTIGLITAASRFDVSKGKRFSTYASWWIVQAISRAIKEKGNMIRVPVNAKVFMDKVKKAQSKLFGELGREASNDEIAKYLGEDVDKVENAIMYSYVCTSLDVPAGEEGDSLLVDFIEAVNTASPEDVVIDADMKKCVNDALDTLPEKQATILRYLYGFYGRLYTLEEVGKIFGISKERVRQLRMKAINTLRHCNKFIKSLRTYYLMLEM